MPQVFPAPDSHPRVMCPPGPSEPLACRPNPLSVPVPVVAFLTKYPARRQRLSEHDQHVEADSAQFQSPQDQIVELRRLRCGTPHSPPP